MEKMIPSFGVFTKKESTFLDKITKDFWGIKHTNLGSVASNSIFENLPFREEIAVPAIIIGTRYLRPDSLPNYQEIRNNRMGCKVLILLQDDASQNDFYTTENWPDYFVNGIKFQLFKAEIKLSGYKDA